MYMIWFVLHDAEKQEDVIHAWEEAGVKGITIYPSMGVARLHKQTLLREDIPLIPSMSDIFIHEESWNRTFTSIVSDDSLVERVVAATEKVIGDLNKPNTGILSVIPLAKVYGLDRVDG